MDEHRLEHGTVEDVLREWTDSPEEIGNITARKIIPAVKAKYGEYPNDLHPSLQKALTARGFDKPYIHQSRAIHYLLEGKNVVVVTPTASGKTLSYNVPAINEILSGDGKALYLFPTKALSQDQLSELKEWEKSLEQELHAFTYDGDTKVSDRTMIRKTARILLSNPDMLHLGMMPHHTKWASFFGQLKYVVIDEMHVYRGVFGSHFANIMRRLKRICEFYGVAPQFICCSATIANPQELAESLIEKIVELVDENGAPSSEKEIIFYNPPVINPELGIRANCLRTTKNIARHFLKSRIQTIVFTTSRMNVEIMLKYLREDFYGLTNTDEFIKGYRGGYLPSARREIEKGVREGKVTGIVATNALELGIDIGSLDACFLAGYPGSVASTWQQTGRAGRRSGRSVAVLVARSNPLDQFIVKFPDYFFGRSPEHGLINADNLQILIDHIINACFELPMRPEEKFGGENLSEIMNYLEEKGILHVSGGAYHYAQSEYPAEGVSIRNIGSSNILVIDSSEGGGVVAEVDLETADRIVHENAIYMAEGAKFLVEKYDLESGRAYVKPDDSDYYTVAKSYSEVTVKAAFDVAMYGASSVEHGEVEILSRTTGFKKVKFYTGENLGEEDLDLPERSMHTTAYWFSVPESLVNSQDFTRAEIIDGVVGISNVLHNVAALTLMCDPSDLGYTVGDRSSEWFVRKGAGSENILRKGTDSKILKLDSIDVFEPTVYLYEYYPGGVGFSPVLFEQHAEIISRAAKLIQHCDCPDGCPSCVGPVEEVGLRGKDSAKSILNSLLKH